MRDQAKFNMEQLGVTMTKQDEEEAMRLFPRVSGLSRRIVDSPTLSAEFEKLLAENPDIRGNKTKLTRRVATRWNSDFACLKSHLHFKDIVKVMIATPRHNLKKYALSSRLWELSEILCDILEEFQQITDLFSQAEVPLVVEIIPMLHLLEENLKMVRDDVAHQLDEWPVVRIAAEAALLLLKKYSILTNEAEMYHIAMVMCPDRKLQWFADNGFDDATISKIRRIVVDCFNSRYQTTPASPAPEQPTMQKPKRFAFKKPPKEAAPDSIERYLTDPLMDAESLQAAGGYLGHWTKISETRPQLAKMGLDFCSIPATSVDAERAFSAGRLQINHLQHNMSSQTFKARMGLKAYIASPAYPGFERVVQIIRDSMRGGKGEETEAEE